VLGRTRRGRGRLGDRRRGGDRGRRGSLRSAPRPRRHERRGRDRGGRRGRRSHRRHQGVALHRGVQPHAFLQQAGHATAHLGRVGALGEVEAQAVRAGRGRAQRRVAHAVDAAHRREDRLHVEALLPLTRLNVTTAQVGRDPGQRRRLRRRLRQRGLRNSRHVRLGRHTLRQYPCTGVGQTARPSAGVGRWADPRAGVGRWADPRAGIGRSARPAGGRLLAAEGRVGRPRLVAGRLGGRAGLVGDPARETRIVRRAGDR
jgi:hypothetical protein